MTAKWIAKTMVFKAWQGKAVAVLDNAASGNTGDKASYSGRVATAVRGKHSSDKTKKSSKIEPKKFFSSVLN